MLITNRDSDSKIYKDSIFLTRVGTCFTKWHCTMLYNFTPVSNPWFLCRLRDPAPDPGSSWSWTTKCHWKLVSKMQVYFIKMRRVGAAAPESQAAGWDLLCHFITKAGKPFQQIIKDNAAFHPGEQSQHKQEPRHTPPLARHTCYNRTWENQWSLDHSVSVNSICPQFTRHSKFLVSLVSEHKRGVWWESMCRVLRSSLFCGRGVRG